MSAAFAEPLFPPVCSIAGCEKKCYAHGWCEMHYKRNQNHGSPHKVRGTKGWTETQLRNLRRIYEAYPAPNVLPSSAEMERFIGRDRRSISVMATKLGLGGGRPSTRRTLRDRPCECCGETFRPAAGSQRCCSLSCGTKLNIAENGHNRGMAGKSHSPTTKARLSVTALAVWARATEEERAVMLDPMRRAGDLAHSKPLTENVYSRTRSGKREDLNGLFVRSGWEANYARYLTWLTAHNEIAGWAYEPQTFEFPVKRGTRFYTPDFRVDLPAGGHEWHEVKGWMDAKSATRLKRFAKYYPAERLVLIDESVYRPLSKQLAGLIPGWER